MKRKIILVLLLVLSVPVYSYSAPTYEIYTWGYMDIMYNMLNAVNKFMGTSNYAMMFKIAALLALITIFLSLLSDKGFSPILIFQKILLIIGIQALLFSPLNNGSQAKVNIIEASDGVVGAAGFETVENVPIVVAFPLYVLSNIEKAARDTFRTVLNEAAGQNGIFLEDMSVITALNVMDTANNMRISDVNFIRSYQSFMENCIVPDILTGFTDVNQLVNSDNAWDIFGVDLHKSRIGSFYDGTKNTVDGKIMTCDKLYANIDRQIAALGTAAENQIKGQLGLAANQSINGILGSISKELFNFQNGQTQFLQNAMMLNTFSDAYANLGSSLGMEENALGYGMAKAQETAKMTGAMQAIQAKKYLPTAKGYMTVIFVALIPFIIIIALITSNFKKPFAMIFGLLLALALWNIGEQLLDFIIIVRTKTLFMNSGLSAYNLESQPFLSSGITDMLNLSLSMYWMIPTLAFSVATLSGFGAASMMGSISGIATAGVSGAAAEAASGSMSAGNIRMSNINMNKYDAAQTMNAGTSTKMSLDYQQTASNQSSVRTGTENFHHDQDQIKHDGSTHIYGPNGEHYEVNGTTTVTAGGMQATGMIQQYDKHGNVVKQWEGSISASGKDMGAFKQDTVNGDEASYQATEIVTKNLANNENINERNSYQAGKQVVNNTDINERDSYKGGSEYINNTVNDTRDVTKRGSEYINNTVNDTRDITRRDSETVEGDKFTHDSSTNIDNSYTENDSKNIVKGTKISVGDTVNDYTGAINLVNDGITKYGAHQGSMREAVVDNMTKYQNSIMSEKGQDSVSLNKAWDIAMGADASVGVKVFGGTGVTASVQADLKSATSKNTSEISAADLNRVMNEAIFKGLDADAKANNWTAEQYDQAARERFGAYNDYLKEQAGKSFGPSDSDLAPIEKAEELEAKADKVIKKVTG